VRWELSKKIRLSLAGAWFLLTFSLCAWWMALSLGVAPGVGALGADGQHRMFLWEGSFLLTFILVGGAVLFQAIYRDQRRNEEVHRFFSTFTHELKTSLTSLRLQAEILEEDPRNRENENLRRLLRDVVRLELQLENSLVLAQAERGKLFLEEIPLRRTVEHLAAHWPELQVNVVTDAKVKADQRALECILRNLFQNACVHGQATQVNVDAIAGKAGALCIKISDNGKGFSGDLKVLGAAFVRHTTRSGSGIGLYLSRLLARRMEGRLSFERNGATGLRVVLDLHGRIQ
jgi:signal transduction histidine kinase